MQPDRDAAANDARLFATHIAHVVDGGDVADGERQPVLHGLPGLQRLGQQHVFKNYRQRRLGGFSQRRGQAQRHALQIAADTELGRAFSETQRRGVVRTAAGVLRQPRNNADFLELLQALGAERALRLEDHRSVGPGVCAACGRRLHAAINPHLTAQHPRLHAVDIEATLGDVDEAAKLVQWRGARRELNIVARQSYRALDARSADGADGQAQAEAVVSRARCHGFRQRFSCDAQQRRGVDKAQGVGERAVGFQVHIDRGVFQQVGNLRAGLDQLQARQTGDFAARAIDLKRCAHENQLAPQLGQ